MKRAMWAVAVMVLVMLILFVVETQASFSGWYNSAQDADGKVQTNVDNLDTRLDAIGITDSTTLAAQFNSIKDYSVAAEATVANASTQTLSGVFNVYKSAGGANNGTNTIVLANATAGGIYILINTGTSNHLAVAKSGTWKSPALDLAEGESAVIFAQAANAFYCVSQ